MPGNEIEIARFLLGNLGVVRLNHLGLVKDVGAPNSDGSFTNLTSLKDLDGISTQDSGKKADIYVNGHGVSLKQAGANFPFNRLQRAEILKVFEEIGFDDPEAKLQRIDKEVDDFHNGLLESRSRPWQNLFDEADFKLLTKFLMTEGSPNLGYSLHKAKYILEAPSIGITQENIRVFTFDEYFDVFKQDFFFAIRRQWIGQSSDSEHSRATGLSKKVGNHPWVYDNVSGEPRVSKSTGKRWRDDVEPKDRKTVFMIFVEKKVEK